MNRVRNADGTFAKIHGRKRTELYRVWCAMKERCSNPHNKSFRNYGAKGIAVCTEWRESFNAFREWAIAAGYKKGLTIDRIDCARGYSPDNCRFATTAEQNRNYSRNHNITYNGETHCIADWEKITGINRATILYRIKAGKTVEEIFDKTDGRAKRWKTTSSSCIR